MATQLLPFISDEDLKAHTKALLDAATRAEARVSKNPYENVIDPFSALVDAARQRVSVEDWMEQEKSRQIQKSLQNALGQFHQSVIGSMPGWEDMGKGGSFDVRNKDKKIIGEVKNKHNTMNSTSAVGAYDKLQKHLDYGGEPGYTAYLVGIIPKTPKPYISEFAPSEKGQQRPHRKDILRIDGKSFYEVATGDRESLSRLYNALPLVLSDLLKIDPRELTDSPTFRELFDRAYTKK